MTEFTLTHKVEHEIYRVNMIINELAEDRNKDILPFLMFVDSRYNVDWHTVNSEYFKAEKPASHPFGKRLLAMMEEYKLITKESSGFCLTPFSKEMVETGNVMLPHQGIYEIIVSEDPIFENSLIGCVPDEANVQSGFQEMAQRSKDKELFKGKMNETVIVPNTDQWVKKKIYLPLQDGKVVEVQEVFENGCKETEGEPITVKIMVGENGNKSILLQKKKGKGKKESDKIESSFHANFPIEYSMVVEELAKLNGLTYSSKDQSVCFTAELLDRVSGSLTMKLKGGDIFFDEYGTYRISEVNKIQVVPKNHNVAVAWIIREIQNEVKNGYVTRELFKKITEQKIDVICKCSKNMDPKTLRDSIWDYEGYIEFHKREDVSKRDDVFWHVIAVSDLSLE
ncbi:hypothetical protein MsAg5_02410 [Methanosarcinaceae archaeon Ag5]|uniref:Uncharacterized protein n=1 Tax=Methanolapillus africanus TaxID=3028297 RepID=A0AAE4SDB9_9EURY|nr:hypothetical protein [Methanosarcinaceae archaeon Ag5]